MMDKHLASRVAIATAGAKLATKSEKAPSNPFFVRRVYWLILNGVCDTYEEAISHADR